MPKTIKPTQSLMALFVALSEKKNITNIKTGGLLTINNIHEKECVIIHNGYALIRRMEDRLIIGSINSPMLIGLNPYQNLTGNIIIEAVNDLDVEILPVHLVLEKIAHLNLWQSLLDVTMFINAELFHKYKSLSLRDSWSIIRNQLELLLAEPDFVRLEANACSYILHRTNLSRGLIGKYLAKLRHDKIIEMENGIIISSAVLPDVFSTVR